MTVGLEREAPALPEDVFMALLPEDVRESRHLATVRDHPALASLPRNARFAACLIAAVREAEAAS